MNEILKVENITPTRANIIALEQAVLELPQINLAVLTKHYFAGGMYARELFMPKGSCITGKIHLKEHLVHISFGELTVVTETQKIHLVGPCTFAGTPGEKRALHIHEHTLWTTFWVTDLTTVEECEATLVTNDYDVSTLLLGDK